MNPATAAACASDPISSVISPPRLSESHPHSCRAMKAHTSITVSMAAPFAGVMPRSPHRAMTCAGGIAIGIQHRNDAPAGSAKTALGGSPSTRALVAAVLAAIADLGGAGGARRYRAA